LIRLRKRCLARRRSEDGAAAVEFALIAPLFIVLVFAIVEFSFYLWTAEATNSAARETARRIVVGDCWTGYQDFAEDHGTRVTGTTVSPNPSSLEVGDPITVTVTASSSIGVGLTFGVPSTVVRAYEARMEVSEVAEEDPCAP
jgi:Flp pilus assembly protein TadG